MENVTPKKDNHFEKLKIKQKIGMQVNQGMPDGIWAASKNFTPVEKLQVFLQIQAPHLRRQQRPADSPNHNVLYCFIFCVTFVKPHFMLIQHLLFGFGE